MTPEQWEEAARKAMAMYDWSKKEAVAINDFILTVREPAAELLSDLPVEVPASEPLISISDGTALLRTDRLPKADQKYWRHYTALTPEQQKELREFADYLKAKKEGDCRKAHASPAPHPPRKLLPPRRPSGRAKGAKMNQHLHGAVAGELCSCGARYEGDGQWSAGPTKCPSCGSPIWRRANEDNAWCRECGWFPEPISPPSASGGTLDMEATIADCLAICAARGWSIHWTARGAYLHLEASELIEAWRGKGSSTVAQEAGDVLLVLLTILGASKVSWADAMAHARAKMDDLRTRPRYAGEEYSEAK